MTEWRTIPGYPKYQVSDDGQVRSTYRRPGGFLLKPNWTGRDEGSRRWRVRLYSDGTGRDFHVHALVALAFLGPMPPHASLIRHLNDDPRDNRAENLAYGTPADNGHDAVRNGHHPGALKTACKHGHPLDGANTYIDRNGRRSCKECRRAAVRASYARAHPNRSGQVHCRSCGQFITAAAPHTHGNTAPEEAYE